MGVCSIYTEHIVYSIQCILYSIQYTLYSVPYTVIVTGPTAEGYRCGGLAVLSDQWVLRGTRVEMAMLAQGVYCTGSML